MRSTIMIIAVLLFSVVLAGTAMGQTPGAITGSVTDTNGGVIPGAQVTAASVSTSVSLTAEANEQGIFVFPQIPPGNYTITVEKAGFKKYVKNDVNLSAGDKINAGDFLLEAGDISATVEVQANSGQLLLKSETGERADVLTVQQLKNIGLNGRNVTDLVKLVPGVISGGASSGNGSSTVNNIAGSFNINGTRSDQHEYTVDGVTNLNLGNNTGALVSVNPDALDEVKILTSNYQAEYGRSGGGFIALTTRSGTNDFHGSVRYFRRHDSMNANNFFNNLRPGTTYIPRPLYRYNFTGWDFGGPVYLPHFGEGGPKAWSGKGKLFFFISQEYYNQLVPQLNPVNIRVPTAAERRGDFSNSFDGTNPGNRIWIRDPLIAGACTNGTQASCFPGNIIPLSRQYAPGIAALNLFPQPNTTAGTTGNGYSYNFSSQQPSAYPRRENILRIDWQAGTNTRVSGRWVYNQDDQQFSYGTTTASWNFPLTTTDRKNGPGNTLAFTVTHIFNPSLINEFTFSIGRGGVNISPADDKATRSVTGINTPLLFPSANTPGLIPSLNFGGVTSSTTGNTSVFGPFDQKFVINNFIDNVTKVVNNHIFKFGAYVQQASNFSNSQNHVQSDIDFTSVGTNPLNTGYAYANALLGVYTGYTQANAKIDQKYQYTDISFFAQDTWKIHPRLSLDLGVRFSHYTPYVNKVGPESFFNPTLYNAAQAVRIYRPVCVGASTCASNATTYRAIDPTTAGPPTLANTLPGFFVGKLIPGTGSDTNGLGLSTAGYPAGGIDTKFLYVQPRIGFAWDVTGNHTTIVRGGFGANYDRYRSDVTGNAAQNQPFVLNPTLTNGFLQDLGTSTAARAPSSIGGTDAVGDFPVVYSYSLGVQRTVWNKTIIDVAYVGTQSRHLPRRTNLNSIAYGTTFTAAAQDPTRYAGGVIPATEPGLPTAHAAAGLSFSGVNALTADFLRPFQGYGDILYNNYDGNSTYNSLQISGQRRFSKSLTFGVAYTLSSVKTTISDNTTFTNIVDTRAYDYGYAAFDRRHFFVANFVWGIPKLSGHLGDHWISRAALDNWTISGVSSIATGNPAELGLTFTGQDAGNRLLGAYSAGNFSGQQPRVRITGTPQNSPNEINISAFTVPGINDKGPYPRAYLRNPGFNSQDLSLQKSFPFGKDGRYSFQFRVEAYNVFNHTQFAGVNRTTNVVNGLGQAANNAAFFNNYTGLVVTANTRPAGSTANPGSFFGEYTSARDPRIMQIAAKFYF